eukprot:2654162-Prymnesium_polylepis.1
MHIQLHGLKRTSLGPAKSIQAGIARRSGFVASKDRTVREQVWELLGNKAVEITHLLQYWDEDNNGMISQTEFRKAIVALGIM